MHMLNRQWMVRNLQHFKHPISGYRNVSLLVRCSVMECKEFASTYAVWNVTRM